MQGFVVNPRKDDVNTFSFNLNDSDVSPNFVRKVSSRRLFIMFYQVFAVFSYSRSYSSSLSSCLFPQSCRSGSPFELSLGSRSKRLEKNLLFRPKRSFLTPLWLFLTIRYPDANLFHHLNQDPDLHRAVVFWFQNYSFWIWIRLLN